MTTPKKTSKTEPKAAKKAAAPKKAEPKKTAKKAPAPKKASVPQGGRWYVVDATDQILGRLAARVAMVLTGKDQPNFDRHKDNGAHVVVVNARKVRVTGRKAEQKTYRHFSGYPGGLKIKSYERVMREKPEFPLTKAVRGMLPKNSLGYHMAKKLLVYPYAAHPHTAQKPVELKFS